MKDTVLHIAAWGRGAVVRALLWVGKAIVARFGPPPEPEPKLARVQRPGPYRAEPELDVDFLGPDGEPIGSVTVRMSLKVSATGMLIASDYATAFIADEPVTIAAWRIWIGDEVLESKLPEPIKMHAGDGYQLNRIVCPVTIRGGIDFGPDDDDEPPPDPVTPPTAKTKERT